VLPGQTNGDGLVWAAAGPVEPNILVAVENLTVPYLAAPAGDSIRLSGITAPSARLPLGSNVNSCTVYLSFAMKVTDLTGLSGFGGYLAGFNNATGASTVTPSPVGARVLTRTVMGGYNIGLSKASDLIADFAWGPRVFKTNEVVFIAGSYTFNGGGSDDLARLWINPDPATFGQATPPPISLTNVAGADLDRLACFVVFQPPGGMQPAVTIIDELRISTRCGPGTPTVPMNLGDALEPTYPTLFASGGAYHLYSATGPRLGALLDLKGDGQPTAGADGDDVRGMDDDDGVTFLNIMTPGSLASVDVVAGGFGLLNAWLDFDGRGTWGGADHIFPNQSLTSGTSQPSFNVPSSASIGTSYARFRFSSQGGLLPTGWAPDGEVEDYPLTIIAAAPIIFGGLPHAGIGNALVAVQSKQLVLSNLGTNGDDGVRITCGPAHRSKKSPFLK